METVKQSLHHSCRTELTRQGISLPLDRQSYGRRYLRILFEAFKNTSPITYTTLGRCQTQYISSSLWQSLVFLLNSRCFLFTELIPLNNKLFKSLILFFPKLQSNFAEFLQYSFLIHLSIFYLSTCVSNRYGQINQYNFPEHLTFYIKINHLYKLVINLSYYCWTSFISYRPSSIILRPLHSAWSFLPTKTLWLSVIKLFFYILFALLMSAFSFLISPSYLTIKLLRPIERSVTHNNSSIIWHQFSVLNLSLVTFLTKL